MADKKFHILICNSARPKVSGGGCCNDKGSKAFIQAFKSYLNEVGLAEEVMVRPGSCLLNCRAGISVKILPDNTLYGKLSLNDIPELVQSHLIQGKILDRLEVKVSNEFWWL